MRRYRFVHTADLHLDSPFRGLMLDAPAAASVLREATFRTYDAIIDLCLGERVDALLVAGDIYDGADRSLRAQLRFIDGLRRLEEAGIRAFVCHGNHDPLDGWEAGLAMPSNTVRFGPEVGVAPLVVNDPASPLVYGISYPTRDVRESLLPRFPAPEAGRSAIGLLHANVSWANNPWGTGHEAYAPCTVEDLERTGYDYWALGHVHNHRVLREARPTVVYPGNPQGRHLAEPGPRGVYVVEIDEHGQTTPRFHALDTVRWARLELAVDGCEDEQALLDAVLDLVESVRASTEGRPLAYGLRLHGRSAVHAALTRPGVLDDVRQYLNERFVTATPLAFCARIDDETAAAVDLETLREGKDLLGDVLRLVDEVRRDPAAVADLRRDLEPLFNHQRAGRFLRGTAPQGDELRALLDEAERVLIDEILDAEAR